MPDVRSDAPSDLDSVTAVCTTLTIDDDILVAARYLANRERKSIGSVISGLARQGLQRSAFSGTSKRNGIPLFSGYQAVLPVTLELVNQLRDEQP